MRLLTPIRECLIRERAVLEMRYGLLAPVENVLTECMVRRLVLPQSMPIKLYPPDHFVLASHPLYCRDREYHC
jgi:hypothetical protein